MPDDPALEGSGVLEEAGAFGGRGESAEGRGERTGGVFGYGIPGALDVFPAFFAGWRGGGSGGGLGGAGAIGGGGGGGVGEELIVGEVLDVFFVGGGHGAGVVAWFEVTLCCHE